MSSNGVDLAQYEQKILLIEDDQTLQELYKELLEDAGFTVQVAKDGDEGLSGLMKGGYALVLLDVMLPRKDGIAILKEMKKSKSLQPNGPIVLLTENQEYFYLFAILDFVCFVSCFLIPVS